MTEPNEAKDFLAHCSASRTGNPVLEQIRGRGAEVLLAVFRLFKTSLIHASGNDALRESATEAAETLSTFAGEVGSAATLTFVEDSLFVCGQLLRATRSVYESARELGTLLGRANVSELVFDAAVTADDLAALVQAFVTALRDPDAKETLATATIPHVIVRKIDPLLTKRQRDEDLPAAERILQLYANALVVMRHFYDDMSRGVTLLPHRVKRLAQRLVVLAETEDPAMLGMTAMAKSHRDDPGRAVQTAILALAIGRQITRERVSLAQLAMTALLVDSGRARVVGSLPEERRAGDVSWAMLGDEEERRVPAACAVACVATGGVNPPSAARTVAVTEASWAERKATIGEVWHGTLPPLLVSDVVATARDLLDRLAPRAGARAASPPEAVEAMARVRTSATDRTLMRLLVRAIGVVPTGTVVELETGEWAVVAGQSAQGIHASIVRVVTDERGMALEASRTQDLGAQNMPRITKVIEPDRGRFNITRAFFY